jgi:hypothetical protein
MVENVTSPKIKLQPLDLTKKGHLGLSVYADLGSGGHVHSADTARHSSISQVHAE